MDVFLTHLGFPNPRRGMESLFSKEPSMSKIIVSTGSYNEKRYGNPYIALCDAEAKVQTWGDWLGTPGHEGELSIEVPDTGAFIVMRGQKDFRGSNGGPSYALVVDGVLSEVDWTGNKIDVIRRYREVLATDKTTLPIDVIALRAERDRLVARIAEIDASIAAS
jgi:hypothetical protein